LQTTCDCQGNCTAKAHCKVEQEAEVWLAGAMEEAQMMIGQQLRLDKQCLQ